MVEPGIFEIKKDQIEEDFVMFLTKNPKMIGKDRQVLKFAKLTEESVVPTVLAEVEVEEDKVPEVNDESVESKKELENEEIEILREKETVN